MGCVNNLRLRDRIDGKGVAGGENRVKRGVGSDHGVGHCPVEKYRIPAYLIEQFSAQSGCSRRDARAGWFTCVGVDNLVREQHAEELSEWRSQSDSVTENINLKRPSHSGMFRRQRSLTSVIPEAVIIINIRSGHPAGSMMFTYSGSDGRRTKTGIGAERITRSVTLPRKYRDNPVRPWVPITTRSISWSSI